MIRRHITYANVASTLALVLALGTGTVYAIGEIGSARVKDNSIQSVDLKDGQAVTGQDVRRNTFGADQIDESSLVGSRIVGLRGTEGGTCDPQDSVWIDCVAQSLELDSPSRLLVTATGGYFSEADAAALECEVRLDGQDTALSAGPGEVLDNTTVGATDGFARTLVTSTIPAGLHTVALACQQIGTPDGRIDSPTIAVIAVAAE
jgi:hypothetical protein